MIGFKHRKEKASNNRKIGIFLDRWKEIMYHTNLYNNGNNTFSPVDIKAEEYGISCTIVPPFGYSFESLESKRDIIQTNLGCLFINKVSDNKSSSKAKFIMEQLPVGDFTPIKLPSNELYLGKGMDRVPIIVDMYTYPHVIITGANNSGKTKMMDCILTNLISNCPMEDIKLYLIQLAKDDLVIYEDCKQTYAFANNVELAYNCLKYINEVVLEERSKLIKPLRKRGLGNKIADYNKLHPENKQPNVYVVIDELASILPKASDTKDIKDCKSKMISIINNIGQYGRANCVYFIGCTQRSSTKEMDSFLKSQINTKISFRQNTKKAGEVCMDDDKIAYQLPTRLAVKADSDGYEYLKVPNISDKTVLKYIKKSINPKHRTLFRDLGILGVNYYKADKVENDKKHTKNNKKSKKTQQNEYNIEQNEVKTSQKEDKSSQINKNDFSKVTPPNIKTKEQQLLNNIKKIDNFVPYEDKKPLKVIDKTIFPSDAPLTIIKEKKGK